MEDLINKKQHPKELFLEIIKIWHQECQQEAKTLPGMLIKLNKVEGFDLCRMAAEAINNKVNSFDIVSTLDDALAHMNLNVESVLYFAETLYEVMKHDVMAHRQFTPFEDLVAKQPDFSRELLSKLLKEDKPYVVGYISFIYQEFAKNNLKDIHQELISLEDHNSIYVIMAAISTIGKLAYNRDSHTLLIEETFKFLENLESRNVEEFNRMLVFAYANFIESHAIAKHKIIYFSKISQALTNGAVAQILLRTSDKQNKEKWYVEAFLNLSDVSMEFEDIIQHIDLILYGLISKQSNWGLAQNFFVSWLTNSDVNFNNRNLADLFNLTFSTLKDHRENLEELLTKLFNHDHSNAHYAARSLLSYCKEHKTHNVGLNKYILKSCDYEDILYICRKIMAYTVNGEHICSLCFSIVEAFPTRKDIKGLIYNIFSKHIAYDHPGIVTDFLKQKLSMAKSKNIKEIANRIIDEIDEYYNQRKALSLLKELSPSRHKQRTIFRERNKIMNKAMEDARRKSIINMIASRVVLKQGKGWFSYRENQYTDVSRLGSFSMKMTIPHSEIIHPVDAALERFHFRQAKRGDK